MSGLYLLIVLGIWAGLTVLVVKGWQQMLARDDVPKRRTNAIFVPLLACWLGVAFWYGGGRKMYYDTLVNRMCRQDGGVKVYEVVKLPVSEFDQWGMPMMYQKRVENKEAYRHDETRTVMEFFVGTSYIVRTEKTYLRTGSPSLHRYKVDALRRTDSKLLGESIGYSRGGGDIPGPWQPSSYSCQQEYGDTPLLTKIFSKE